MVTGADVRVRVRSGVVTVQVEKTVVLVLVVVATDVQDNARGVVVAIVGLRRNTNTGLLVRWPRFKFKGEPESLG